MSDLPAAYASGAAVVIETIPWRWVRRLALLFYIPLAIILMIVAGVVRAGELAGVGVAEAFSEWRLIWLNIGADFLRVWRL